MGQPGSTPKSAGDPHRVDAGFTGPIGEWRAVQDRGTGKSFTVCREESHGPASLAVTVKHRRLAIMAPGNLSDETPQGVVDVRECLAGHGLWKKDHKIDRVTLVERHTDLGVTLESGDTRSVPCARINDENRGLIGIDAVVPADVGDLGNPQQGIVRGTV